LTSGATESAISTFFTKPIANRNTPSDTRRVSTDRLRIWSCTSL
jgi:hypothetical protein